MPIETRGLVADWDAAAGRMTVWGATKASFFNRAALAGLLRLPAANVELVELDVGGSFGVRGEFYPEDSGLPRHDELRRRKPGVLGQARRRGRPDDQPRGAGDYRPVRHRPPVAPRGHPALR